MSTTMERLKTPPPPLKVSSNQLLTPPSTGGFDVNFPANDENDLKVAKRFINSQKADDISVSDCTEAEVFTDDSRDTKTPEDSSQPTHDSSATSSQDDEDAELSLDKYLTNADDASSSLTVTEPFAFMKLPLSVRQQVYSTLLVIPALICVRQKHTAYHDEKRAYLYAERRELLPGIAYALAQFTVGGYKFRFARFRSTNCAILRVSKEVHAEAKVIMYGKNDFEIICPSNEISPPPDYKIPLFSRGYPQLIRKLNIQVRSIYSLGWLLSGGHAHIKNAYRGLETLTIIFEMETAKTGFGKRLFKKEQDQWVSYVKRLHAVFADQLFGTHGPVKKVPLWIDFRVLFDGERYDTLRNSAECGLDNVAVAKKPVADKSRAEEEAARLVLKRGIVEAFELFKKGSTA